MKILQQAADSATLTAHALSSSRVVIIPTDTIYGFSGLVPHSDMRIRTIKGRGETKPFIRLIAEPQHLFLYTDVVIPQKLFSYMPGALTLIVPLKQKIVDAEKDFILQHSDNNVGSLQEPTYTAAFRCPSHVWLHEVLTHVYEQSKTCIYSTSANRSGQPPLYRIGDIEKEFTMDVDFIVDGGDCSQNIQASTIISLAYDGSYTVVRQGDLHIEL